MYTHACIKCAKSYDGDDPDAYYCEACNKERIIIAKEIDAKIANKPKKKVVSALQEYDNAPKVHGFVQVHL